MSEASPRLLVATPERVAVSLPVAGVGSRTLAYLVDALLLTAGWLVAFFAYSLVGSLLDAWGGLGTVARVLAIVSFFAVQWVYWTASEVLWRGQTPGKRLLRIRVVRADGSPVGLFESAVRNLLRFVDFLPAFYPVGLVTMLIDPQHRRLGDLAAGTLLVRDEAVDLDRYRRTPGAAEPGVPALAAADVELVTDFLSRLDALEPDVALRLGRQLVDRVGAHLPAEERARVSATAASLRGFLERRALGSRS